MIRFFLRPEVLHIPDGMLSLPVAIVCWLLSAALLFQAVRRTRGALGERQAPLMGIMAAFIFAAQMINFPIGLGTSGHLLGGTLAAIALGPWSGMLVMTSVIVVQALLFQDGGLAVMGANILNMGLITAIIGYGLYRAAAGRSQRWQLAAAGVAAWISVLAAALATTLQLWLSGNIQLGLVAPPMLIIHALIGIGEALITVAALGFIFRTRPDMLAGLGQPAAGKRWIVAGLLATLVVVALSPMAAADPDGLERVASDLGFIDRSTEAPFSIIPDYTIPQLGETALSTILAGTLGALAVGGLSLLIYMLLRRSSPA